MFGVWMRLTLLCVFGHMAGTLLPLLFLPKETFRGSPLALTLEGQYIVKNVVLIGAALVLGGHSSRAPSPGRPLPLPSLGWSDLRVAAVSQADPVGAGRPWLRRYGLFFSGFAVLASVILFVYLSAHRPEPLATVEARAERGATSSAAAAARPPAASHRAV